jgi:hypothetical protein
MFSEVAAAMLRKVGMNVDEQVMDAATWARRLTAKLPPRQLVGCSLDATGFRVEVSPENTQAASCFGRD